MYDLFYHDITKGENTHRSAGQCLSVFVCLCWEGLKIIKAKRSQGQIVINIVRLRVCV